MNDIILNLEEQETLKEMPINEWFYLIPAKFIPVMKVLEEKGFIESAACELNRTGIKWKRIK